MEKIYQQLETFTSLSNLNPSNNDFNTTTIKYLDSLNQILPFQPSEFFDFLYKNFSKGSKNENLMLIAMFWTLKEKNETNTNKLKEICLLYFKDQNQKSEMNLGQKNGKKLKPKF